MSAMERLLQLGREARQRMALPDGQWRLAAAREAVCLAPDPGDGKSPSILRLQHALREALMAGGDAVPGTRVHLARACQYLAAGLALAMHGEGLMSGAEVEAGMAAGGSATAPDGGDGQARRPYWVG